MSEEPRPIPSQCALCARRSRLSPFVCAAFPGGIPGEIRLNAFDHRRPWIDPASGEPGDEGVDLAGSILFEPRPDADPDAIRAVRDYFGRDRIGEAAPPPPILDHWPVRRAKGEG